MNILAYTTASLLAVLLCGTPQVLAADQPSQTRVMTFNIRYSTTNDGPDAWPHRKEQAAEVITSFDPDLLGLQEALPEQRDDLAAALPQYNSVGGGRNADGGGEATPLLYRRTRYDLLEAGMFWLSDTPETPGSTTWGNKITRECTWAKLFDRQTKTRIVVFNTHWDHLSQPSRVNSGALTALRAKQAADAGDPVLVMADFNVGTDNPARAPLTEAGFRDSYYDVHEKSDVPGTFHGFKGTSRSQKIDAILVSPAWKVVAANIVRSHEEQRYPSDHFPVTTVLERQARQNDAGESEKQ